MIIIVQLTFISLHSYEFFFLWLELLTSTPMVTFKYTKDYLGGSVVQNHLPMQKIWIQSLGQEDPLEKDMATHSSILFGEIPWIEEPGRLQSMESQRALHHLATKQWHG